MGPIEITIRLIAGLLLILTNGFFVAIEFALTRARQFTEEEFVGEGSHSVALERAWAMTHDLEIYLTTCQVGITASSIAVGIVAEPALAAIFEPLFGGTVLSGIGAGAVIAFLIINLVHLTHGEQTPTYLASSAPGWSVATARRRCTGSTGSSSRSSGWATRSPSGRSNCSASR